MNTGLVITSIVLATVIGEAKKTPQAMEEVAWVIRNRTEKEWLGSKTAEEVCLYPKQFSTINDKEHLNELLAYRSTHPAIWTMADDAVSKVFEDPKPHLRKPYNVYHYVTEKLYNSDRKGWWSGMKVRLVSNGHVFLE